MIRFVPPFGDDSNSFNIIVSEHNGTVIFVNQIKVARSIIYVQKVFNVCMRHLHRVYV